jgi:hypothetical protein
VLVLCGVDRQLVADFGHQRRTQQPCAHVMFPYGLDVSRGLEEVNG